MDTEQTIGMSEMLWDISIGTSGRADGFHGAWQILHWYASRIGHTYLLTERWVQYWVPSIQILFTLVIGLMGSLKRTAQQDMNTVWFKAMDDYCFLLSVMLLPWT